MIFFWLTFSSLTLPTPVAASIHNRKFAVNFFLKQLEKIEACRFCLKVLRVPRGRQPFISSKNADYLYMIFFWSKKTILHELRGLILKFAGGKFSRIKVHVLKPGMLNLNGHCYFISWKNMYVCLSVWMYGWMGGWMYGCMYVRMSLQLCYDVHLLLSWIRVGSSTEPNNGQLTSCTMVGIKHTCWHHASWTTFEQVSTKLGLVNSTL